MQIPGTRNQQQIDDLYDASGSITTGGTAQLLLPQRKSCSYLFIQNTSAEALAIQFGLRPATATLTNGVVTSVTVNDAGMGLLVPPDVMFIGGGNSGDPVSKGGTLIGWPSPSNAAQGVAVLTSNSISSITITNGGSGYLAAPFVYVRPARNDPTGVGIPAATTGIVLQPTTDYASYWESGPTACPTVAVSVYGGTTGQTYTCKWMP